MRKSKSDDDKPNQNWLITYGDLMTLLMTFFVLLLTFSSIQLSKFKKAMGSLRGALGVLEIDRGEKIIFRDFHAYDAIIELQQELEKIYQQMNIPNLFVLEKTANDELRLIMNNEILFDPGKSALKPSVSPLLEQIGSIVKADEHIRLLVEGHTDNIPIHTVEFESNWELSSARALSVVKFFINNLSISPRRLTAIGHGEYKPLVPNTSPETRAQNRRVEIFFSYENVPEY